MAFTPAYAAWGGAMLPFPAAEDSFASEFRICYSNPHRITGREWGSVPANSQLFRIRLKCWFLSCSTARRSGLPRRFAPRNDSGGGAIAPQCLAPADTRHVSAHLAHQTFLHPLTHARLLNVTANHVLVPAHTSFLQHVIAHQCAHWCGNPHPRRETWQTGTTLGKFVVLFRICPRRCFLLCCAAGVRIATSLRSSQ